MSRGYLIAVLALAVIAPAQNQTVLVPAAKDNTLFQNPFGAISNGAGPGMFAGNTATGSMRRALVAFDIAGAIPAGATIRSAELRLEMDMTASGPIPISLHTVLQDWGEGTSVAGGGGGFMQGGGNGTAATVNDATWNHAFFPTTTWASQGGDFNPAASATTTVDQSGQYTWSGGQLISDVQAWLNTPASNFGWLINAPGVGLPEAKRFRTKEHPDVITRPLLVLTVSLPTVASAVPNGYGCPVGTGPDYALSISAPPVVGSTYTVSVANGLPNGTVEIFLSTSMSLSPIRFPGTSCGVWIDVPSALLLIGSGASPLGPFPLDATGGFSFPISIPNDPALAGVRIAAQANSVGATGLATSNGLDLTLN